MPAISRRRAAVLLAGLLVAFAGPAAAPANAGFQLPNGLQLANGLVLQNGLILNNGLMLQNGGDLGGLSLDGVILPDAAQ